jgi:hypothetical protein
MSGDDGYGRLTALQAEQLARYAEIQRTHPRCLARLDPNAKASDGPTLEPAGICCALRVGHDGLHVSKWGTHFIIGGSI